MRVIKTYNEMFQEKQVIEKEIQRLEEKKLEIIAKYYGAMGEIDKVVIKNRSSKVETYAINMEKVNKRLDELKEELRPINKYLKDIEKNLLNLDGEIAELYRYVVIEGLSVTKAVEKLCSERYVSSATAWRKRKELKKILEN